MDSKESKSLEESSPSSQNGELHDIEDHSSTNSEEQIEDQDTETLEPIDRVERILAELSDEDRHLVSLFIHRSTSYSGPLPPAEQFERYERAFPGAGDRIFGITENEQKIRDGHENKKLNNESKRIISATLLGVGLIIVSGIAMWKGSALVALGTGLAGVASLFFKLIRDLKLTKQNID